MYRYGKRCCFREAMVVVRYQSEKIHLYWGVDDWRIISILICFLLPTSKFSLVDDEVP